MEHLMQSHDSTHYIPPFHENFVFFYCIQHFCNWFCHWPTAAALDPGRLRQGLADHEEKIKNNLQR
jgi:hypothetical protein